MSSQHPHGELVNENVHHEESDINIRAIITFIVVLTVIAVGIQIAMVGLFKVFNVVENKNQPVVSPLASGPAQVTDFPSPSLQTTPWADLQKLRAGENAVPAQLRLGRPDRRHRPHSDRQGQDAAAPEGAAGPS